MRFWLEAIERFLEKDSPRELSRGDLRFYQNWMVQEIIKRARLLLAAEMGLGKTVAVLTAIVDLKAEGRIKGPILIIAPLLVAEETWPDEIKTWTHTRHLTFSLVLGNEKQRVLALKKRADLYIINRENVVWLYRKLEGRWPFKMVIYDEASRLKSGRKRTKASKRLKKDGTIGRGRQMSEFGVLARIKFLSEWFIELSGTPAPKGLIDLWGPIYILDGGERLGSSKDAFLNRWFDQDHWTYSVTPRPYAEREIMERVSDIMISLREEDYLTLPERVNNPVNIRLPESILKQYRKFEKTLYLEEYDIEAVSSGVLTNKLLQFANGSIYDADGNDQFVHDLKLKALDRIHEEAFGDPLLIAYSFQFDINAILKKFPHFELIGTKKNWKDRWNAGEIPGLVLHPASAGHGLNIQFGGHIGVWYGMPWSLELYQQFNKRLHRSGQKAKQVVLHHILAEGTVDYDVFHGMNARGATQDAITEYVRVRLEAA